MQNIVLISSAVIEKQGSAATVRSGSGRRKTAAGYVSHNIERVHLLTCRTKMLHSLRVGR